MVLTLSIVYIYYNMPSSEVFKMEPKALHSSMDKSTQQKWLNKATIN